MSRLIYFGSSCMYQGTGVSTNENTLFKGELEETSFAYAMAKLSEFLTEAINNEFNRPKVTALIPLVFMVPEMISIQTRLTLLRH